MESEWGLEYELSLEENEDTMSALFKDIPEHLQSDSGDSASSVVIPVNIKPKNIEGALQRKYKGYFDKHERSHLKTKYKFLLQLIQGRSMFKDFQKWFRRKPNGQEVSKQQMARWLFFECEKMEYLLNNNVY